MVGNHCKPLLLSWTIGPQNSKNHRCWLLILPVTINGDGEKFSKPSPFHRWRKKTITIPSPWKFDHRSSLVTVNHRKTPLFIVSNYQSLSVTASHCLVTVSHCLSPSVIFSHYNHCRSLSASVSHCYSLSVTVSHCQPSSVTLSHCQ